MRKLIWIIYLLLNEVCAAQTIHTQDDEIVYKETIRTIGVSEDELLSRARVVVSHLNDGKKTKDDHLKITGNKLQSRTSIKLPTTDHSRKQFDFDIEITMTPDAYQYKFDSFVLIRKEAGNKPKKLSAKELLKGMESSGSVADSTEEDLNEIDMYIQKLIDRVNADMKKPSISVKISK